MRPKVLKKAEWITAILLSAAVIILLFVRSIHAGGLWRDECGTVRLARTPTTSTIIEYFDHQTFPPLVPFIVRFYTDLFGESDAALRCFGFLAGAAFVCVAWFNARAVGKGVPLLSLALFGLSPTFLAWGTTVSGYGFGAVLIVLTFAAVAKLLRAPTPAVIFCAFVAAIVSQQLAMGNLTFVLAIAVSALVVALVRGAFKTAVIITVLAVCCLLVGALYLHIFSSGEWRIVLHEHCRFSDLWSESAQSFGADPLLTWTIRSCFVTAIIGGLWALIKPAPDAHSTQLMVLLYSLLIMLLAPLTFFTTLLLLSYHTSPWHYLLLLAIVAAAVDLSFLSASHLLWVRLTRLTFAAVAAVAVAAPAWRAATERETNIDVVAARVTALSKPDDLIVVAPWQFGISFSRYYQGEAPWTTLPTMDDHRFHRYDLLMTKMISPHPIDDVLQQIQRTLSSGNRVWFVGGIKLPSAGHGPLVLPPAPNSTFGWDNVAYSESWREQVGAMVREHAGRGQSVPLPGLGPISYFENVPLSVVEGWQ